MNLDTLIDEVLTNKELEYDEVDPVMHKSKLRKTVGELGKMGKLPRTLGVIPDGNRRFASREGIDGNAGHLFGSLKVVDVIRWCADLNLNKILFYLLSVDNIKKRSKEETQFLYSGLVMMIRYLMNTDLIEDKKLHFIHAGDTALLPNDVNSALSDLLKRTENNKGMNVVLCVGYLGKDEINRALKKAYDEGGNDIQFDDVLRHCDVPEEIDMIIRTGKKDRMSDFLTFQSGYSELAFIPKFFPDVTEEDLLLSLIDYATRGKTKGGNAEGKGENTFNEYLSLMRLVESHIPRRCAKGFVRSGIKEVVGILYQELGWMLKGSDW